MAASSTAVSVLAPNGRRQTVKISSSTPLLQVLEDVCKKQGFSPEDYDLKFQRTVLDLSLQWRFASLPNNAKLEMVPSTRQRAAGESRVRIALQLEDGSRVQDSFSSAQTLWDLISYFPQIRVQGLEAEETPACVYMRDEIVGVEALKQTTLKSLGLTGGSAIVRYVLKKSRSPEGEVSMETAAVSTEKIEEPPHAVPDHRPPQEPRPAPPTQSPAPQPHTNRDPEPQPTARPKTCPTEESVRPKTCPPEDLPGPSGARPSQAPPSGFVPFSGGGQRLGGDTPHGLGMTGDTPRNYSSTTAGPPQAKKHKPSNDAKHPANANLVDREPLVYHMDAAGRCHSSSEDLPDEFFEVTVDDIRKRFAQLKSERKLLEEAPLMTKALREVRMKEKMERYPKVVVRVQFPDRYVLQGFFRPLETVGALRQFVRSHLADPQLSFYLFIAPPKTTLDDPTATLFQANLFPAALVYCGSDVQTDSYLQRELLESSVSALQADEAIAGCMPRSPTPASASLLPEDSFSPPEASDSPANQQGGPEDQTLPHAADGQSAKPIRTDPSKVPKWLKLPGKK
ncbi:hypothetical protein AGOR_G00196060 [Albula goreensis]|uniref:UBX domain-containing protein n=1 Tax=Albula goreensis TaxID=1534307 RepID=A0A8T3CVH1_9TELE|nr:hypothetical protein AGOR_G00196060 [Albula goreensis]